jgi:hypothetical protein
VQEKVLAKGSEGPMRGREGHLKEIEEILVKVALGSIT